MIPGRSPFRQRVDRRLSEARQRDRHVLVLDKDNCWLYEMGSSYLTNGKWSANVTAVWDMTGNEQRPYTWTSADAAGLPIFPGLARYDEVAAGQSTMPCASRCPTREPLLHPARIGPRLGNQSAMRRLWGCACA